MNRCHTKGRENSRELCVLLPLPGERAGVRASVSSNLIFGVGALIPSRVTWFVGTLIPSLQFVENTCKSGVLKNPVFQSRILCYISSAMPHHKPRLEDAFLTRRDFLCKCGM